MKSTLQMQYIGPRVPHFRLFRSAISHCQNIAYYRVFPLTPMLKWQSDTFFLQIAKTFMSLYSLMTHLFVIDFGSDQMKTGGGVAF